MFALGRANGGSYRNRETSDKAKINSANAVKWHVLQTYYFRNIESSIRASTERREKCWRFRNQGSDRCFAFVARLSARSESIDVVCQTTRPPHTDERSFIALKSCFQAMEHHLLLHR